MDLRTIVSLEVYYSVQPTSDCQQRDADDLEKPSPGTRFAREYDAEGNPKLNTIDWEKLSVHEPDRVAAWILYLHKNECTCEALAFLPILYKTMNYGGSRPPQWAAFSKAALPCVLMDIACEDDMFQERSCDEAFKTLNYGIKIVSLLGFCTLTLCKGILSEDDRLCKAGILSKRDRFMKAMWKRRHLIQLESDIIEPDHAFSDFITLPYPAHSCVGQILVLSKDDETQLVPLSSFASHFLLFYFAYDTLRSNTMGTIGLLHGMVSQTERPAIKDWVNAHLEMTQSDETYVPLLMAKICDTLRNESIVGMDAYALTSVCAKLIFWRPDVFAAVDLPEGFGLVPSLTAHCHRQTCSSTPEIVRDVQVIVMEMMRVAVKSSVGGAVSKQLTQYAGPLNYIAILAPYLVLAVKENLPADLNTAYVVLNRIQSPIVERGHRTGDRELAAEFPEQQRTTERIWHDILKDLVAIRATNDQQRELKKTALHVWRSYGSLLNLRDGANVVTMRNKPSNPSSNSCRSSSANINILGPWAFQVKGDPDPCTVDWKKVVSDEPDHVASWLLYLHESQDKAATELLLALHSAFGGRSGETPGSHIRPLQRVAFRRTVLPCILMEIASEKGMVPIPYCNNTFKTLEYSTLIFNVCALSLEVLDDEMSTEDSQACRTSINKRRESFCEALWLARQHLQLNRKSKLVNDLSTYALRCVMLLLGGTSWLSKYHDRTEPAESKPSLVSFTSVEQHVILYYWAYTANADLFVGGIPLVWSLMVESTKVETECVGESYTKEHIERSDAKYLPRLIAQFSRALRRDVFHTVGTSGQLVGVCTQFMNFTPEVLGVELPKGVMGLVPSLMLHMHRRRCTSSPRSKSNDNVSGEQDASILLGIQSLCSELARSPFKDKIIAELARYAGKLNFVAFLLPYMVEAVERNSSNSFYAAAVILRYVFQPIHEAICPERQCLGRCVPEYADLRRTTAKIWHDTLKSLLNVKPKDEEHHELKEDGLRIWRQAG
ncbi:hypothetical protein EIP91_010911, partial [Steccherinum ochraceum]